MTQFIKEKESCPRDFRVLICDDEPRTRQALKTLLSMLPINISADLKTRVDVIGEASNGQEAVTKVAECQPDVVLMDARMPLMDGIEATRVIKKKWPRVRVILLTMYSDQRVEAMAAGVDAFFLKGCRIEDLLKAIQTEPV